MNWLKRIIRNSIVHERYLKDAVDSEEYLRTCHPTHYNFLQRYF